jgi:RNA polymerase sigma-70 factor (ECF subfamily)
MGGQWQVEDSTATVGMRVTAPLPRDTSQVRMTESSLAEVWRAGRAAWPTVELDAEMFIAYLAKRLPDPASPVALAQLRTTDLYLACACSVGNAQAIAAFEQHCLRGLDRALAPMRLAADVIAEVKQRVRCRALVGDGRPPRIAEFTGRGGLRGWVRVIAVREALRMIRSRQRYVADDDERLQVAVSGDPGWLEAARDDQRRAFARAFDRALRRLEPRTRTMLRQHLVDGLTVDQLGALYSMHRATAARTLERARRAILAATRDQMRAELEVSSTELSSILRAIRSRLEVTLRGLRARRRGGASDARRAR